MWKEEAVSFPALSETKGFDSSIEHALSLLEDSPVAETTVPEPVRPMVKLAKLNMLTTPVGGQTTLVDSIFCDLYCADVNKHTEHCITRYGFLKSTSLVSSCLQSMMFSNQAGVLHELQRRAGGEEDEKKMGRQGQVATGLIVFAAISTVNNA